MKRRQSNRVIMGPQIGLTIEDLISAQSVEDRAKRIRGWRSAAALNGFILCACTRVFLRMRCVRHGFPGLRFAYGKLSIDNSQ
jgi:hypothetical protein